MKSALKFLSGSVVTYMVMAACSSAGGPSAHGGAGESAMAMGGADGVGGAGSVDAGDDAAPARAGSSGMLGMMMDPVPDASAEPGSDGTRLKAIYQIGADGSRQQQYNWWDSERKEECSFVAFSDSSTRCVPTAQGTTGTFFSDAGCASSLFISYTSNCPTADAKYGMGTAAFACGAVLYPAIYSLTPSSPAKVFQGKPGACTEVPPTGLVSYAFYTGTPLPLASFVTATKEHD